MPTSNIRSASALELIDELHPSPPTEETRATPPALQDNLSLRLKEHCYAAFVRDYLQDIAHAGRRKTLVLSRCSPHDLSMIIDSLNRHGVMADTPQPQGDAATFLLRIYHSPDQDLADTEDDNTYPLDIGYFKERTSSLLNN
ncbi:MAG TPA: hypothetical protein VJB87_01860 [Candidatus Nanoarchaeia archaeon]|nr:hypothetical protein [Candidatus Nanoarchaeia archaeon]